MSRGQKIRYRLLQVLVVLAVIVIGVAVGLKSWMKLPDLPVTPDGGNGDSSAYDGAELPDVAKSGRKEGVYTFLLVGQDTAGGGNTDTMMLITFDTVNKTINGMSLPRDTMINVDRKGSGHRLNAVYNYNKGSDPDTQVQKGMAALKKEVGKLTGITPDFYVMVQWEAVGEMVDALGGVYFDVPFDMDYDDPTPGQDLHIHLKEGYQKLDGDQAMGLIRWRHNNDYSVQYPTGDLGRMETQQAFLKAVAAECLKPATLLKAPALAEVFMENVTTDLSLGNILAFAQLAAGTPPEPPPWRSRWFHMRAMRGREYCMRASSTCRVASRVRARLAKMSRMTSSRSMTHSSTSRSHSLCWEGESILSKTTQSARQSSASCFTSCAFPVPHRNLACMSLDLMRCFPAMPMPRLETRSSSSSSMACFSPASEGSK